MFLERRMSLSKEDAELYYKLHWSLLFYVNQKLRLLKGLTSISQVRKTPFEELNKIRDKLYKGTDLIDSFIRENPSSLTSNELEIAGGWRHYIKKRFIILRYLKNYTIFLDVDEPPKAYGVLALMTPLDEMFGPVLPVMVEATLLPFKDRIIYDGIILGDNIIFGGGIRRDFNDAYQEAKARFGIILSLPFSPVETEQSDAGKLRFYLRSGSSREEYGEEIEKLIGGDDSLQLLYHQEMGKIDAKIYGRRLRKIGLRNVWFAFLQGSIIASGLTREKLEEYLREILSADKLRFVYFFHLK
jgi:hypothetical protein